MFNPDRVSKLSQLLLRSAENTERRRSLSAKNVQRLSQLGVFRALVPASHGGTQGDLSQLAEALIILGQGCPATAWVGSLFAVHSVIAAWFPTAAQDMVWANGPDAKIGSSFAPMGKLDKTARGLRLSGRWSFSSGLDHADWLLLGATSDLGAVMLLVPAKDIQIEDDWRVAGLAGSGSKSLKIDGLLVGQDQVLAMADLESGNLPGGLPQPGVYRLPWRPLFSYAFIPPVLGAATKALEISRTAFGQRVSAFTGMAYKDRPLAWSVLAKAQGDVEAGLALMRSDLGALEEAVKDGPPAPDLVLRTSFNPALIAKLCREAVNGLMHASGASALYQTRPLQRLFRDLHAMTSHPALNYDLACEAYGRGLLS